MKKIRLMLILLLLCTDAVAQWSRIGESQDDGGYTVYADMDTLLKAKDEAKMWILIDYNTEQEETGAVFLSKMIRHEYDCKGKHSRVLAYKLFSWAMGQGELVRAYSQPQQWVKIQPQSMNETEWSVACGQ